MHGKYNFNKMVQLISGLTLLGLVEHLLATQDQWPHECQPIDLGNSA